MARLTLWPGLLAALAVHAAPAQATVAWDDPIAEASTRFGIPVAWIQRVIDVESGGRTTRGGRPIRSRVGAMGLMQLMPGTWRAMRRAHGLGHDPDDPRDNILAGTAYLRAMYNRFGYPGLFAAYNAGPARYAEHLARGRRLPAETIAYVAKVTRRDRASGSFAAPLTTGSAVLGQIMIPSSSVEPAIPAARSPAGAWSQVFFELSGSERR